MKTKDKLDKRFLFKKPNKGDLVKIYHGEDGRRGVSFGSVVGTDFTRQETQLTKLEYFQQILVVDQIEEPEFKAIRFFLPSYKVRFNKLLNIIDHE